MMSRYQFYRYDDNDIDLQNPIKTDCGYLNGYVVGDRLLEDVIFKITVTPDGNDIEVKVTERCKPYFDDLNTEKFLKLMKKYALETDVFCSKSDGRGDNISLYDFSKDLEDQAAHWEVMPSR